MRKKHPLSCRKSRRKCVSKAGKPTATTSSSNSSHNANVSSFFFMPSHPHRAENSHSPRTTLLHNDDAKSSSSNAFGARCRFETRRRTTPLKRLATMTTMHDLQSAPSAAFAFDSNRQQPQPQKKHSALLNPNSQSRRRQPTKSSSATCVRLLAVVVGVFVVALMRSTLIVRSDALPAAVASSFSSRVNDDAVAVNTPTDGDVHNNPTNSNNNDNNNQPGERIGWIRTLLDQIQSRGGSGGGESGSPIEGMKGLFASMLDGFVAALTRRSGAGVQGAGWSDDVPRGVQTNISPRGSVSTFEKPTLDFERRLLDDVARNQQQVRRRSPPKMMSSHARHDDVDDNHDQHPSSSLSDTMEASIDAAPTTIEHSEKLLASKILGSNSGVHHESAAAAAFVHPQQQQQQQQQAAFLSRIPHELRQALFGRGGLLTEIFNIVNDRRKEGLAKLAKQKEAEAAEKSDPSAVASSANKFGDFSRLVEALFAKTEKREFDEPLPELPFIGICDRLNCGEIYRAINAFRRSDLFSNFQTAMSLLHDPKGWDVIGDLLANPELIEQFLAASGDETGGGAGGASGTGIGDFFTSAKKIGAIGASIDRRAAPPDIGVDFSSMASGGPDPWSQGGAAKASRTAAVVAVPSSVIIAPSVDATAPDYYSMVEKAAAPDVDDGGDDDARMLEGDHEAGETSLASATSTSSSSLLDGARLSATATTSHASLSPVAEAGAKHSLFRPASLQLTRDAWTTTTTTTTQQSVVVVDDDSGGDATRMLFLSPPPPPPPFAPNVVVDANKQQRKQLFTTTNNNNNNTQQHGAAAAATVLPVLRWRPLSSPMEGRVSEDRGHILVSAAAASAPRSMMHSGSVVRGGGTFSGNNNNAAFHHHLRPRPPPSSPIATTKPSPSATTANDKAAFNANAGDTSFDRVKNPFVVLAKDTKHESAKKKSSNNMGDDYFLLASEDSKSQDKKGEGTAPSAAHAFSSLQLPEFAASIDEYPGADQDLLLTGVAAIARGEKGGAMVVEKEEHIPAKSSSASNLEARTTPTTTLKLSKIVGTARTLPLTTVATPTTTTTSPPRNFRRDSDYYSMYYDQPDNGG